MTEIKEFKSFKVNMPEPSFTGTKIEIGKLIGKDIVVHDYRIVPSKFPEPGREHYLQLQVAIGEIKYVSFCVANTLMGQLKQIPRPEGFPFKSKIALVGERLEFT